jgi:DNA-directed RNA polymerase specialized sigma24 family protein
VLAGYQQERDRQALLRALSLLAPSQRTLVVLFYFEGYSYAQIGEITGSSLTRVRRLLYRARQRLKAQFVRLRDPDEDLEMLANSPSDPTLEVRRLLAL